LNAGKKNKIKSDASATAGRVRAKLAWIIARHYGAGEPREMETKAEAVFEAFQEFERATLILMPGGERTCG
jgi:hypothetical protein